MCGPGATVSIATPIDSKRGGVTDGVESPLLQRLKDVSDRTITVPKSSYYVQCGAG